mmetsp:Transcript_7836/g.28977  ORF Transcript_7836/g.28977 Transcript_7836/m.28977 type:complete len:398 (-) Transcript_7836:2731-3924(-)
MFARASAVRGRHIGSRVDESAVSRKLLQLQRQRQWQQRHREWELQDLQRRPDPNLLPFTVVGPSSTSSTGLASRGKQHQHSALYQTRAVLEPHPQRRERQQRTSSKNLSSSGSNRNTDQEQSFLPKESLLRHNLGLDRQDQAQPNARKGSNSYLRQATQSAFSIAVDVDEVLGRFLHSLNQYVHSSHGHSYELEDYFEYNFAKVWDCSGDESNDIVHSFFKSEFFTQGILPIPEALSSLQRLKNQHTLQVVTSRQHVIQRPTLEWLDTHFPEAFEEVHFGNHFALEGKSRKKSEICAEIGADVLIDDNPHYAVECARAGIHVLLFDWHGSYPWSKLDPVLAHHQLVELEGEPEVSARAKRAVLQNIQVVHSWQEVEAALSALACVRSSAASPSSFEI